MAGKCLCCGCQLTRLVVFDYDGRLRKWRERISPSPSNSNINATASSMHHACIAHHHHHQLLHIHIHIDEGVRCHPPTKAFSPSCGERMSVEARLCPKATSMTKMVTVSGVNCSVQLRASRRQVITLPSPCCHISSIW